MKKLNLVFWTALLIQNYNLCLQAAAQIGRIDLIKEYLKQDVVNYEYINDGLLGAVFGGQKNIIELLLDNGADINYKSKFGVTPLITAIGSRSPNNREIAELLLSHGADVNTLAHDAFENRIKKTALMEAVIEGKNDIVKMLLERGARINDINALGHTALYYAIQSGNTYLEKILKAHGATL